MEVFCNFSLFRWEKCSKSFWEEMSETEEAKKKNEHDNVWGKWSWKMSINLNPSSHGSKMQPGIFHRTWEFTQSTVSNKGSTFFQVSIFPRLQLRLTGKSRHDTQYSAFGCSSVCNLLHGGKGVKKSSACYENKRRPG